MTDHGRYLQCLVTLSALLLGGSAFAEPSGNPVPRARVFPTAAMPVAGKCEYGSKCDGGEVRPSSRRTGQVGLKFSHEKHSEVGCKTCHSAEPKRGEGEVPSGRLPGESTCLKCHSGKQARDCGMCHETKPGGRLRTRFVGRVLVPTDMRHRIAHDRDFRVRHRWLAADEPDLCKACHEQQDCKACHDGGLRPRGVHFGDFLTVHAQQARTEGQRCRACHQPQTFCAECHARLGLSSWSPTQTHVSNRTHPRADVWVHGPNLHATEARLRLDSCTSCHAEVDCVNCHSSKKMGGTASSPHPPGYQSRCGAERRRNSRPCALCHGQDELNQLGCE